MPAANIATAQKTLDDCFQTCRFRLIASDIIYNSFESF